MYSREDYAKLAAAAVARYPLDAPTCSFIQHSENVTFKVQNGAEAYLLRLHEPRSPAFGTHGADKAAIRSELLWLEALQRRRLPVQRPLRNRQGELVTQVEKGSGGKLNCSLLSWLEGGLYSLDLETADTVAQIGDLAAQLHLHASRWRIPDGFVRPARDQAYFESAIQSLEPAAQDGRIAYQDFKALKAAIEGLVALMGQLRKTRRTHGVIHADLHRGNFVHQDGRVSPIDFSFCSFGHYAFDLGICLANTSSSLHAVFLESYTRFFKLPPNYSRLIESFFIGGWVGTFSLWVNDPQAQEILAERVPYIAREFAVRFNRDERFWFDQRGRW
jgi:Ser/Thr protein kinase RdoA (MazF antagonist)